MTATTRDLWFAKAHRLEEDRLTLLRLLEALSETRTRLNSAAAGLVACPAFLAVERAVMAELTALNDRQNEYIAEMMAFEPTRDEDSGRLGGVAGDLLFTRRSRTREAAVLSGRRAAVIASALASDVERVAAEQGISPRAWIEGTLRRALSSGAVIREETRMERVRRILMERPMTVHQMARASGLSLHDAKVTLDCLRRTGRARFAGKRGQRGGLWVSLEG